MAGACSVRSATWSELEERYQFFLFCPTFGGCWSDQDIGGSVHEFDPSACQADFRCTITTKTIEIGPRC